MKLISIPLIFLLSLVSTFAQIRPNRFTTNSDPGAWVYIPMPALTAYANGTNYFVDWTTNSYRVQGTGDVCFQFSTNWGLPGTNRFANIYFPATNAFRKIFFANAATNWHGLTRQIAAVPTGYAATIKLQEYGSGETNVVYTSDIDSFPLGTNWMGQFDVTSVGGLKLWVEASQKIFQDEYCTIPVMSSGQLIRGVVDLAGITGKLTNAQISTSLFWRGPNEAPGNIPCFDFVAGQPAYLVSSNFTAYSQPNYLFVMFYGRGSSLVLFDGLSEGNRMACQLSENPSFPFIVYSGTSLSVTPGNTREWRLFTFLQNSTSSIIRTNGVQAISGNSGTQTPSRFVIGADYNLGTFIGDGRISEMLFYHATLTAQQITNIEQYLWNKYGTPHP